jgi:mono/diheme cytochrome c family protein
LKQPMGGSSASTWFDLAGRRGRLWAAMLFWLVCACDNSLPESGSADADLYVRECGVCHVAYPPHLLKPAMWEVQVGRMDDFRRQRGMPPMSARDRRAILDYLRRHAG